MKKFTVWVSVWLILFGAALAFSAGQIFFADGVKFPGSQVASADLNTLDDYEEGPWTPTDDSGATLSLTTYNCTYIKIGKKVFIEGAIYFPSTADARDIKIGGLPYAAANGSDNTGGFAVVETDVGASHNLVVSRNNTFFFIISNADVNIVNSGYSSKRVKFSGSYTAAN